MNDSLLEYYEACACDSGSDADDRQAVPRHSSGDDEQGQSPWRAASGNSPLRGRARLLSIKHRSGLLELKLRSGQGAEEGGLAAEKDAGRSTDALGDRQCRSSGARAVAHILAQPFETHQGRPAHGGFADRASSSSCASRVVGYRSERDLFEERQRSEKALRDELVFDVLCALRLETTQHCRVVVRKLEGSTRSERRYELTQDAKTLLERREWAPFVAVLERILLAASQVATLQAEIEDFHSTIHRIGANVNISALVSSALSDEAASGSPVHGTIALGEAAFSSLFRFGVFARNMIRSFRNWVLEVQELTSHSKATANTVREQPSVESASSKTHDWVRHPFGQATVKTHKMKHGAAASTRNSSSYLGSANTSAASDDQFVEDRFSTSSPALLPLLEAIEHNIAPLQRLSHMLQESHCFRGLQDWEAEHLPASPVPKKQRSGQTQKPLIAAVTEFDFADACAEAGAGLLDYLIVRLSALQDTSSMDLYRVYMALLLHCAWPYVLLVTTTICGLVHSLDPHRWRRQLPRLFRSSFSHIRVGDVRRRYPTDILSLLLNCVGYEADGFTVDGSSAAVSALQSSRRFILRCFATFAQKQKQVRKRERRQISGTAGVAASLAGSTGGADTIAQGDKVDITNVRNMTVTEILNELISDAGSDDGQPWESLFLPLHVLREKQLRHGREQSGAFTQSAPDAASVGGAPAASAAVAAAEKSVMLTFPAAVPLGFTAVDADVPGQDAYRRAVYRRQLADDLPFCSTTFSLAGEEEDEHRERTNDAYAQQRRSEHDVGALWILRVFDTDGTPDLQLVNHNDHRRRKGATGGVETAGNGETTRASAMAAAGRHMRRKDLWLNTTIPAARWIAAALLIPIGVVVQRLHERRAEHLFRRSAIQRTVPITPFDLEGDADSAEDAFLFGERRNFGTATAAALSIRVSGPDGRLLSPSKQRQLLHGRVAACYSPSSSLHSAPSSFSFLHATKLLVDVALCRDKPRIIEGFLERLFHEPFWWHRTDETRLSEDTAHCGAAPATSSRLVSFLFADALRGKRYGDLVSLTVLAKSEPTKDELTARHEARTEDDQDLRLTREMLDVFASFKLTFFFPDELALILLPTELCVAVKPRAGSHDKWEDQVEQTYSTFFWERRRGRYSSQHTASPAEGVHPTANGIAPSDVWSYVFGYLCALHFAQISLREQRKALHIKDTQDHELLSVLGVERRTEPQAPLPPERKARRGARPAPAAVELSRRSPLAMLSRGLGSAYYSLSFVVDALLSFTLREASAVIYRLERMLASMEACGSLVQLCQGIDTLLLRLHVICFPAQAPLRTTTTTDSAVPLDEVAGAAVDAEVRRAIGVVLGLALDPSRMPVRLLSSRSRVAIEGLVALASNLSASSVLKSRLRPLLAVLTFNSFYGWEGQSNYQFR